jgi:phosphatidylglycerol:prolipoprotein diacylglycerol transferase
MIPWIQSTVIQLGPLQVQTWGTLVAIGFGVGTWIAARRAKAKQLDPTIVLDLAFWVLIAALIGSRMFHVVFYEPSYYLAHPLDAIDPRQPGFAIAGGILASAGVAWIYLRRIAKKLGRDPKEFFIAYGDTLVWGLPWGCGIGRLGCFLIHDHPGTLSHVVLAVKYPDGQTRHDLGLYLSIAGFVLGGVFLLLNPTRKSKTPGFFIGAYLALDGLTRLCLDFLRTVDVRYAGLTPTQWLTIPVILLGAWLVWKPQRHVE